MLLTTPVVHQHHTKDVFMCFLDGNRLSQPVPRTHKESLQNTHTVHSDYNIKCNVSILCIFVFKYIAENIPV